MSISVSIRVAVSVVATVAAVGVATWQPPLYSFLVSLDCSVVHTTLSVARIIIVGSLKLCDQRYSTDFEALLFHRSSPVRST